MQKETDQSSTSDSFAQEFSGRLSEIFKLDAELRRRGHSQDDFPEMLAGALSKIAAAIDSEKK